MRLIDADALMQKRNHAKRYSPEMYVIGQGYVMDAPTIDAVPVVRGEWIQKHHIISLNDITLTGTYPTCNICNYAEVGMAKKSNYCPNCGAKMEGESNE